MFPSHLRMGALYSRRYITKLEYLDEQFYLLAYYTCLYWSKVCDNMWINNIIIWQNFRKDIYLLYLLISDNYNRISGCSFDVFIFTKKKISGGYNSNILKKISFYKIILFFWVLHDYFKINQAFSLSKYHRLYFQPIFVYFMCIIQTHSLKK